MDFQFYCPTQLIVGQGKIDELADLTIHYGSRAFLVYGSSVHDDGNLDIIQNRLQKNNITPVPYRKPAGEPDIEMVDQAAETAKTEQCDVIVTIGGGAVIDLGKAVAGLATNGGSVLDYMEGIGQGRKITEKPLPHIAVPTTAGTGAEVTKNAVITAPQAKYKKSFRSPYLFPTIAILDAELSVNLPPEQTAYSGMDAITQLIESYITQRANPITDALALHGLQLALPAIKTIYKNGKDKEAREAMLLASTLSGVCLANAGLGMAHGFAPALGAMYDVPHGKACAILLPHAMQYNQNAALPKFADLGRIISERPNQTEQELADRAIHGISQLITDLGIPRDFKYLNVKEEDIDPIVERSKGNSMNGNPIPVTDDMAREFLVSLL